MATTEFEYASFLTKVPGLKPSLIDDICRMAAMQYAAGLIVAPRLIRLVEHNVSVMHGEKDNLLTFRQTFSALVPKLGAQHWLVTLQMKEPGDGVIDVLSITGPVQFYVYNDDHWSHIFDFEHPWHKEEDTKYGNLRPWTDKLDDGMTFPVPVG